MHIVGDWLMWLTHTFLTVIHLKRFWVQTSAQESVTLAHRVLALCFGATTPINQSIITCNLQGVEVFSLAGCQWDAARTSVHKFENAATLRFLVLDECDIQVLHLGGASDLRVLQVCESVRCCVMHFCDVCAWDAIDHVILAVHS